MGRFRDNSGEDVTEAGIDMSPLIDCVFILLIFFIVTTVFVQETGVDVEKPLAVSAARLEKNSVLIAVTSDDRVVYGGRDIGVAGVQPLIKRMLAKEDMPVIVLPDTAARSSLLIRVVNEAKLGGATRVDVATRQAS